MKDEGVLNEVKIIIAQRDVFVLTKVFRVPSELTFTGLDGCSDGRTHQRLLQAVYFRSCM
jgi:hypothetical protein